ncbi:MAG TPA: amidase family protein [Burkholderiales bacterium]|nr:amidase family protein [Burkholderiales bacterium]
MSALSAGGLPLPGAARLDSSLIELSAVEAVAAMRSGDLKAEDYAKALLDRCEKLKHLNAFTTLDYDRVMEMARDADRKRAKGGKLGVLHGLPVPVKDSINTKDLPTTLATEALRDFRPGTDAAVVTALYREGALLLGKTNLHELQFWWTNSHSAFGPARNPYDPTRISGGSSGGTAVAVSGRMAPAGLAGDTNGSIRVPAALCGVIGFRPTTLRWPQSGVMPLTPTYDTVGPHTRSVADAILFDSVVTGTAQGANPISLKGTRIGVPRGYYYADLDPEVERVTKEVLRKLKDAGVELVDADPPYLMELVNLANYPIIHHETGPSIDCYLKGHGAKVTLKEILSTARPDVRQAFELFVLPGGQYRAPYDVYTASRSTNRPLLQRILGSYLRDNGLAAMIFPATLCPATPIGHEWEVEYGGRKVPTYIALARNISPGSCAGLPGLVIPGGLTSSGLPVGIEFDGHAGGDRELLALGLSLEKVLGPIPPPQA